MYVYTAKFNIAQKFKKRDYKTIVNSARTWKHVVTLTHQTVNERLKTGVTRFLKTQAIGTFKFLAPDGWHEQQLLTKLQQFTSGLWTWLLSAASCSVQVNWHIFVRKEDMQ